MDELELIRSFRSELPLPSGAATARAERAWRRDRRHARRLPRVVAAAGLAAAAIAGAIALPGGDNARLGPADATAAQTLRRAAAAQSAGLPRPLRAGEFWYLRARNTTIIGADETRYTALQPELREEWVAIDGTRRALVRRVGPLRFPGPRDRARWEAAGRPPLAPDRTADYNFPAPRKGPFYLGDEPMSYAELLRLPKDAESLYRRLRAAAVACACGHSVDSETFVIVGDMLRSTPIPDDLRAALLRAAALIPGIELVEHERDVAGRRGLAVAFDYAGHRDALVFDRGSYELLGETDRMLTRDDYTDGRPGQLIGGSAYIDSGIVTSQRAHP